jgi:hypothetical protein
MSQSELLKLVARRLEAAGIDYMITGSVVSSLQGEPRATHDIDVVVAVDTDAAAAALRAAFPEPDFYLEEAAVREAIATHGMFNLIDTREGDKVDFWLLTDDAFDRARFGRRYVANASLWRYCGSGIPVASAANGRRGCIPRSRRGTVARRGNSSFSFHRAAGR